MTSGEDSDDHVQTTAKRLKCFPKRSLTLDEKTLIQEFEDFNESSANQFPNIKKFIEKEIKRVTNGEKTLEEEKLLDIEHNVGIRKVFKIPLRWTKYRTQFNLIGRVLGPKGETLKQLQKNCHCRIAILGRGSIKNKKKEEELRQQGGKYDHLNEPLHLWIQATGTPANVFAKLHIACTYIEQLLSAKHNDDLFSKQMEMLSHDDKKPTFKYDTSYGFRGAGVLGGGRSNKPHFKDPDEDEAEDEDEDHVEWRIGSRSSYQKRGISRSDMVSGGSLRERSMRSRHRRATYVPESRIDSDYTDWDPNAWWGSQWGGYQWSYPGYQWGMDSQWGYWPQNYNPHAQTYNQALAAVYGQYPAPTENNSSAAPATSTSGNSDGKALVPPSPPQMMKDNSEPGTSIKSGESSQQLTTPTPQLSQNDPQLQLLPGRPPTPGELSEFSESELLFDTDPAWLDENPDVDRPRSIDDGSSDRMEMSPVDQPGSLQVNEHLSLPSKIDTNFRQELVQGPNKFEEFNFLELSSAPPLLAIKQEKKDDGYAQGSSFQLDSFPVGSRSYQLQSGSSSNPLSTVVEPHNSKSPIVPVSNLNTSLHKPPLLPDPLVPLIPPEGQIDHAQLQFIQSRIKQEMSKNVHGYRDTAHKRPGSPENHPSRKNEHQRKIFRRY